MRVSIITGGGSGIGAAVARRLAAPDECLMLHGQGADAAGLTRLKAVAAECERAGAKVAWSTGDLADAGTEVPKNRVQFDLPPRSMDRLNVLKLKTEAGDQVLLPLSERTTRQLQQVISEFNRTRDLLFVAERPSASATLQ